MDSLQTLSGLGATPQLQTLTLSYLDNLQTLSGLEATQLQTLTLYNLDNLQTLSGLEATPQLQTLTLSYLAIADLSGLEATPQLQTLTLNNLAMADLSGLEQLTKLKKLCFYNFRNKVLTNSQCVLALPLDTMFISNSSIDNINFPGKPWKIRVLIYAYVGEDRIVEMAKRYRQTKFLYKQIEGTFDRQ